MMNGSVTIMIQYSKCDGSEGSAHPTCKLLRSIWKMFSSLRIARISGGHWIEKLAKIAVTWMKLTEIEIDAQLKPTFDAITTITSRKMRTNTTAMYSPAIDDGSPLRELYASGALQGSLKGAGEALLIHAVVQAFDNVYGGDLSATHTYGKGSLLEGAFADMIRSEGGRTTIDWDNFNATRPLGSPVRDADPEPSPPRPGRPYISCGSARASYGTANALDGGAPRSALEPYCPYSTRLCLLLAEGGVDFTMVKIDLTAVQGWYSAAFKPGERNQVSALSDLSFNLSANITVHRSM